MRKGQIAIGPKEVLYLALAAVIIILTFTIFAKLGAQFFGTGGEEKAMKDNFNNLGRQIDTLLDNPRRYVVSPPLPTFLDSDSVIVGFNSDWSNSDIVDSCKKKSPAYIPVVCQGKPCLVLYSDDEFDDPKTTNRYILASKTFDLPESVYEINFIGEPDYSWSPMWGEDLPASKLPKNEVYKTNIVGGKFANFAYFLYYGECAGVGTPGMKQFHLEKFIDDDKQVYIYMVQIREGSDVVQSKSTLETRKKALENEFAGGLDELNELYANQKYKNILLEISKRYLEDIYADMPAFNPRFTELIIQKGQESDFYALTAKTLFRFAQEFDIIEIDTPPDKMLSLAMNFLGREKFSTPSDFLYFRAGFEYVQKGIKKSPTFLKDHPEVMKEMGAAFLGMPEKATFKNSEDYIPGNDEFNKQVKLFLAKNFDHFSTHASRERLLEPLKRLAFAAKGDQKKEDSYLVVSYYLKKSSKLELTSKDVVTALDILKDLKETFPESPDFKETTWQVIVDNICHQDPTVYFEARDFPDKFKDIQAKCFEVTGKGTAEQELAVIIKKAEDLDTGLQHAKDNLKVLQVIHKNFLPKRLDDYRETFERLIEYIGDGITPSADVGDLEEKDIKYLQTELDKIRLDIKYLATFSEYTNGKKKCESKNWIGCASNFEEIISFFPPKHYLGKSDVYNSMLIALAEAYKETNSLQSCDEIIIENLPKDAPSEFIKQLTILCPPKNE